MENRLYTGPGHPLNGVVECQELCAALIPCLNEGRTIGPLVHEVGKYVQAVWVVDDGSSDDTKVQAEKAGAAVVRHEVNLGKGASLRDGLNCLAAAGYNWAVTLDGDGQHDPAEIPAFLAAAQNGAALVIGDRMAQSAEMSHLRRFVNRWTSARISKRIGLQIPDSQCGFRLISLDAWKHLRLQEDRFAFESEMLVAFAKANYKVHFVPINCLPAHRESRIHPIADTCRWFRWWLRC